MTAQNAYRSKSPAHIAFMSIPAHGHVNPGLGLVSALVERGHRVTYAIPEAFAPQVVQAGAEHVNYVTTLPTGEQDDQWTDDLVEAVNMFLDEAISVVPQLLRAYEGDRPDLIVWDIGAQHAAVLGEVWSVPYVSLSPTHVAFEDYEDVLGWDEGAPGMDEFMVRFQEFLDGYHTGLTHESMTRPRRSVVAIPRGFQYRGDTVSDSCTFVGPMITERGFQGDWQPPGDKPVLLISLGSAYTDQPRFYADCLRAFGDRGWHVVLSVGNHVDPASLGSVPSTVEVHSWVPQQRILSHASAFVTHCGMGGTMEALHAGVPMIAVPQGAEQFANAARVAELGLGVHLPLEEADPEALRAALDHVTSDVDIQRNIAVMREEIATAGGVHAAVEVLEAELPER